MLILQFSEFLKKASIRTTNNTLPTPRARSDVTKRKRDREIKRETVRQGSGGGGMGGERQK